MNLFRSFIKSFSLALFCSATFASFSPPSQLAVGYYDSGNYTSKPFFMKQDPMSLKWNAIGTLSSGGQAYVHGTDCNTNLCATSGQYNEIYVSNDAGSHWLIEPSSNLPSDLTKFATSSISCATDNCYLVGQKFSGANSYFLLSGNPQHKWEYVSLPALPSTAVSKQLTEVKCSGNFCILVGSYKDSQIKSPLPLIYFSNTAGQTWQFISPSQIKNMPFAQMESTDNLSLFSASCYQGHCIAGGYYQESVNKVNAYRPLLIETKDNGETWSVIPAPSRFAGAQLCGEILDVNCSEQVCAAVGDEWDYAPITYVKPFIMSYNRLKPYWLEHSNVANLPAVQRVYVESVSCAETYCTAIGYTQNEDNSINTPVILHAKDYATAWSFNINIPKLPTSTPFEVFNDVSCNGYICNATGRYLYKGRSSNYWYPLLVTSQDGGLSWAINENSTMNSYQVYLSGLTGSTNQCGRYC